MPWSSYPVVTPEVVCSCESRAVENETEALVVPRGFAGDVWLSVVTSSEKITTTVNTTTRPIAQSRKSHTFLYLDTRSIVWCKPCIALFGNSARDVKHTRFDGELYGISRATRRGSLSYCNAQGSTAKDDRIGVYLISIDLQTYSVYHSRRPESTNIWTHQYRHTFASTLSMCQVVRMKLLRMSYYLLRLRGKHWFLCIWFYFPHFHGTLILVCRPKNHNVCHIKGRGILLDSNLLISKRIVTCAGIKSKRCLITAVFSPRSKLCSQAHDRQLVMSKPTQSYSRHCDICNMFCSKPPIAWKLVVYSNGTFLPLFCYATSMWRPGHTCPDQSSLDTPLSRSLNY